MIADRVRLKLKLEIRCVLPASLMTIEVNGSYSLRKEHDRHFQKFGNSNNAGVIGNTPSTGRILKQTAATTDQQVSTPELHIKAK